MMLNAFRNARARSLRASGSSCCTNVPRRSYKTSSGSGPSSPQVQGVSAGYILAGGTVASVIVWHGSLQPSLRNEAMELESGVSLAEAPRLKLIPFDEVARHNKRDDCWVIIHGEVYDVTRFIPIHPGGLQAILKLAGKDVTKAFAPIHSLDVLLELPQEAHVGSLDLATAPAEALQDSDEDIRIRKVREALPPPEAALNLNEIEKLATTVLTNVAYAYYASAGDDEYTFHENSDAYKRYWFRPRVMNKVSRISTASSMLGVPTSLPVFVCPAALARLGHPGGEVNIVQAAAKEGIIQGISINASCSLDEIAAARKPNQPLMFQIYLDRHRPNSERLLRRVERDGYKAIMLTVDSAVPGKRERDQRAKGDFQAPATSGADGQGALGVAQAISGYQDPDISWDDIAWIRSITSLPLIIKGVQCVEDVEKAHQHGVEGVVISNHGGRSLDFSPAPIDVLHELNQRRPDLTHNSKFEVYVDGGVRRGTDVIKALCLGAKGVGLGRPILYGNGAWGEPGVRRVIQIIREEVETSMRLLGVTRIEDLKPEMVKYVDRDPGRR
ncbi:Cytochrome b2, mitochondrial precursor [Tulasnella sp. JGI-2019a]|nr:Cytochrome b2, mitochondrial precursor [Tulasnella sp. JGI-2019a]